jgi:hypothetical protein
MKNLSDHMLIKYIKAWLVIILITCFYCTEEGFSQSREGKYVQCLYKHCLSSVKLELEGNRNVYLIRSSEGYSSDRKKVGIWENGNDTLRIILLDKFKNDLRSLISDQYINKEFGGVFFLVSKSELPFWEGIVHKLDSVQRHDESFLFFSNGSNTETLTKVKIEAFRIYFFERKIFIKVG